MRVTLDVVVISNCVGSTMVGVGETKKNDQPDDECRG